MLTFLTCVALCCTTVTNPSAVWTERDQFQLNFSRKRCGQIYENSPCLVKYKKIESGVYSAVCGGNNVK